MCCNKCGQMRSKKNIARHVQSCLAQVKTGEQSRSSADSGVGEDADRATSRSEVMASQLVPSYSPTAIGAVLASVIAEAVPALLDQHDRYSRVQLIEYLQNCYPEIPESIREVIVIAATSAARQAALFHSVVEKNAASRDGRKREFAAEAASALSFWALGLRPAHRSTGAFVATSSVKGTPDAAAVETEQVQIDMTSLPVPMIDGDQEFQQLIQDCDPGSRSMVLSQISSVAGCLGNEDLDRLSQSRDVMPSKSVLAVQSCYKDLSSASITSIAVATTAVTSVAASVPRVTAAQAGRGSVSEIPGGDVCDESPLIIHAPSDPALESVTISSAVGRPPAVSAPAAVRRHHDTSSPSRRKRQRVSHSRSRSPGWRQSRPPARDQSRRQGEGRITISLDEYRKFVRGKRYPWK